MLAGDVDYYYLVVQLLVLLIIHQYIQHPTLYTQALLSYPIL